MLRDVRQLGFSPATLPPGAQAETTTGGRFVPRRDQSASRHHANDGDVAGSRRAALDRSLAGGPALEPTLADGIVHIAAQHGDQRLYDALSAAAAGRRRPPSGSGFRVGRLRSRHYRSFADLSSDARGGDGALPASFFENPVARPHAWSFVKTYWSALEPKLRSANAGATLTRGLDAFCDGAARDDILAFFETHRLPGATGALDQTIGRINNCIDLREKQTTLVSDWLASRR
jgi:aminopeptidase N/puromycin-sensitive aminopeptidase